MADMPWHGVARRQPGASRPSAGHRLAGAGRAGRRRGTVQDLARPVGLSRHLLRHLPQRSRPRRGVVVQPGCARRRGGQPRALGEGASEGPHRPDAASWPTPAGCRYPRHRPDHRRRLAGPRRRRQARPRTRRRASTEPHRVPQRDPRPPEPAGGRRHAVAARRSRRGFRQRRGQPGPVAVASRTLPGRGARNQPPGRRRCHARPGARVDHLPRAEAARAGRAAGRRPAVRLARRVRGPSRLPPRRRIRFQDSPAPPGLRLHRRDGAGAGAGSPDRRRAHQAVHRRRRSDRDAGAADVERRDRRRHAVGALHARGRREPGGADRGSGGSAHGDRVVRRQPVGARGHRAAAAGGLRPRLRRAVRRLCRGRCAHGARAVPPQRRRRHAEPAHHLHVPRHRRYARRVGRRGR